MAGDWLMYEKARMHVNVRSTSVSHPAGLLVCLLVSLSLFIIVSFPLLCFLNLAAFCPLSRADDHRGQSHFWSTLNRITSN